MKNFKYIILIFCALSFFGCKKNQLGGKSNIKGKVQHHGKDIAYARVYIKFNAKEFPGENIANYDTYVDADKNGSILIEHIYHGDYYFYGVGVDDALAAPGTVKGGVHLKVKMMKEHTGFVVPVSED